MATEFETLARRHRRELHVHCYRMLGSFDEAEDAVQETLLRAWRGRSQIAGGTGGDGFRAWLYRIATNYCLDVMRRRKRRPKTIGSYAEIPWLTPYPDRLLDEIPAEGGEPGAVAVARETIELAFIAGPGQRRLVRTAANRQPATASYLRVWDDTEFRAFKLDVFDIRDGLVAQITTFGSGLFEAFGLPATWEAPTSPG
jgi:RNA polymerase sigma factor (sigma-70 family)